MSHIGRYRYFQEFERTFNNTSEKYKESFSGFSGAISEINSELYEKQEIALVDFRFLFEVPNNFIIKQSGQFVSELLSELFEFSLLCSHSWH